MSKTILYILLIVIGWAVGQYPYIPSFELYGYQHIQPDYHVLDACISVTLLAFSLALFFVFINNFWLRIIIGFMVCGFINNAYDEFAKTTSVFGTSEKISLLLALLTTSLLIWIRRRHIHSKTT